VASIQLFDRQKHLVQEYGLKGIPTLLPGTAEITEQDHSKRSLSMPIQGTDGKLVGYLQIQLTTKLRENATRQFGMTMAWIVPILLLALGLSGHFFAGKAAEPIEETFKVLRQFLSDAGHELSTPIAIIQAATENFQAQLDDTPHAQRLAIISRSTDRMSRLVQDLMLLTKVDARQPTEQKTSVQLDRVIKACIEEFSDRYKDKDISLTLAEVQPSVVFGDPDSLHRVLTNLLENALRYTNQNGAVTVSLRSLGKTVRLSVEDSGVGIPAESLPHLFDRFYRVDKSRARSAGGFGLGLAIVKAIVESHKGYVEVSSEVGHGSRFSIFLPSIASA
jgi:signal transduction histidine kinase